METVTDGYLWIAHSDGTATLHSAQRRSHPSERSHFLYRTLGADAWGDWTLPKAAQAGTWAARFHLTREGAERHARDARYVVVN